MRLPWWITDAFPDDVPTTFPMVTAARIYLARLTLLLVVVGAVLLIGGVGLVAVLLFA